MVESALAGGAKLGHFHYLHQDYTLPKCVPFNFGSHFLSLGFLIFTMLMSFNIISIICHIFSFLILCDVHFFYANIL
jgi:hypothetical protein